MTQTYKGCTIKRSNQVLAGSGSSPNQYLYAIEGRFVKPAGKRPFLPTIAECKNWINGLIGVDEMAADHRKKNEHLP